MVLISASVKADLLYPGLFCFLGYQLSHLTGGILSAGLHLLRLKILTYGGCCRKRFPLLIIDDLGIDMLAAPKYAEPGTLLRAA